MEIEKTEAIVLSGRDMAETSLLVTLFTPQRGKVKAMAKGAKKTGKGFMAPYLQPLNHLEVVLLIRETRSIQTISEVHLKESFPRIREDFDRLNGAIFLLELTDQLIQEGQEDPVTFSLLLKGLEVLGELRSQMKEFLASFMLHMLTLHGFEPQMEVCLRCGKPVTEGSPSWFSLSGGGVLCQECSLRGRGRKLSLIEGKVLRTLKTMSLEKVARVKAPPAVMESILKLLSLYIQYHLGFDLKSSRLLESMA